jgi:hypothetical protein
VPRILTAASAVGRIAVRGASHSRLLRAGYTAVQTTARSVGRILHLIFLQIAGLFFCLFALGFASRIPRTYHDQVAGRHGPERVYLLVIFTVVFGWFGVSSFWRARKK